MEIKEEKLIITPLIASAIDFATKAHGDQKRKYINTPYIEHPIAVATLVSSVTSNEHILSAAILHDVVEDTPVTLQDIESKFGIIISRIVEGLTDVYTSENHPNIKRLERKKLECYRIWKTSDTVKTIKLADLIDNTSSIVEHDPNFAKVYLREKEELLKVLSEGDSTLLQLAIKTLKEAKIKIGI